MTKDQWSKIYEIVHNTHTKYTITESMVLIGDIITDIVKDERSEAYSEGWEAGMAQQQYNGY